MNHTHYALINEENDVVAVLKRDDYKSRIIKAIEDETGDEIIEVSFTEVDYYNFQVQAKLTSDCKYVAILRPTWEY